MEASGFRERVKHFRGRLVGRASTDRVAVGDGNRHIFLLLY